MKKVINLIILLTCLGLFLSCENEDDVSINGDGPTTGQGGSLARFAIINQTMYYVDNGSLQVFDVSDEEEPVKVSSQFLQTSDVETITSYGTYLYLGSSTGLYIYSIARPHEPRFLSRSTHVTGCDPVATDGEYAYVTIRNSESCNWNQTVNVLQIYDVKDQQNPELVSTTNMIEPIGLAVRENYLFVCDYDGIKIFDVSDKSFPVLEKTIPSESFDIIIDGDNVLTVSKDGINQYMLETEPINLVFKSSIATK